MAYAEQVDNDLIMDNEVSTSGMNGVAAIMQKHCTVGSLHRQTKPLSWRLQFSVDFMNY